MSTTSKTIHSTTHMVNRWVGRSAVSCIMSLAKNPAKATGERVDVKYWLDTQELELRFITGTYADVVVIDRVVIPKGTVMDAEAFARFHLLDEEA